MAAFELDSDPTVNNDETEGFEIGGEWRNTTSDNRFRASDVSAGAAVWEPFSEGNMVSPGVVVDDMLVVFDGTGGVQTKEGSKTSTEVAAHLDSTSNPNSVTAAQVDAYTKSEVDVLVDVTLKAPEAFAPSGTYPVTYEGNAVDRGDSFRITAAGTMGAITVNIEDLLIALVDTPGQTDASWMVAESNRDQATETVKGVAELATQAEADAGTNDTNIVTPLKMATAPVSAHTHAHADTTGQTADDHHAEAHTVGSHSDTSATGAQLDVLVGGGETALHSHAGGGGSGDVVGPASVIDDRLAVFDGTTGKLIKQGGKTATEVGSHLDSTSNPHGVTHASTTGQGTDDHHAEDHAGRHQNGGADELNVGGLSGALADPQTPASHVHSATDLTSGVLDDGRVQESNVTQHESAIDHDALAGFEVTEHRIINDAGTSTTETWSASKVDAEISAVLAGVDIKAGVDTTTTGVDNIALTGEQTLNGLLTSTSRVLVTEQTVPADNGIYVTAAGAWSRAADADTDAEVTNGNITHVVNSGSTKFTYKYLLVTPDPITVGTTGQTWEEHKDIDFGTTSGTATEGNDSRVPSQDENDALLGTSGTPSTANRYVTNADSRNSDARTPVAHTHNASDINAGTLGDARVAQSNVTQHQSAIDHDALSGFEAGEHRVINDAGTSATELWSASKIDAELATVGGSTVFPDRGCVQSKDGDQLIGVSPGDVQSDDGLLILTLASAEQIDLSTSGVDGLDTGTVAADTHYSVWVIGDSTATNPTATLASLSTTSPTLPSGYDRKRRRGWVLTDGSSNIHPFIARGGNGERIVMYTYARTDALVFAALDTQVFLAQSLSAQLPPTANFADLTLVVDAGNGDFLETRPTGSTVADDEGRRLWARNLVSPTAQWNQVINGSQSFDWRKNDDTGDATIYVWGYGEII